MALAGSISPAITIYNLHDTAVAAGSWTWTCQGGQVPHPCRCTVGGKGRSAGHNCGQLSPISNVSLTCLPGKRHSHNGCICRTFLHCAFSNASLNCLPEKMHNHIGSICMTFLHRAFSNVTSNHLHEKRHSHIGCIYLTFPHCASSYDSASYQKKRKCSYIGYT